MNTVEKISIYKDNLWNTEEMKEGFVCVEIAKIIEKTQIMKLIEQITFLLKNMEKFTFVTEDKTFLTYKINTVDYNGTINAFNERIEKENAIKAHLESLKPDIFSCNNSNTSPRMSVSYSYGYIVMPIKSACLFYDILRVYDIFYINCIRKDESFHLYAPDKRTIENLMSAVSEAIGREIFELYVRYNRY